MKTYLGKLVLAGMVLISLSFAGGTVSASMKKEGKMMCCMEDGKMVAMDKEMTMGDMKVGTNGVVTMKDGKKLVLKDGMMIDKSGNVMPYNGLMMKDGKMMVIKEGKMSMMKDKEMKMDDGSKCMNDGNMVMKDGKKMMMKEGMMCEMKGGCTSKEEMMKE